jgi:hypothetical protein
VIVGSLGSWVCVVFWSGFYDGYDGFMMGL